MTHNKILEETNPQKRQPLLNSFLEKEKRTHKDIFPRYLLWREYLLRSDAYREICEWVRSKRTESEIPVVDYRIKDPDAKIEDYLAFTVEYERVRSNLFGMPLYGLCRAITGANTNKSLKDRLPTLIQWAIDSGYEGPPELLMTYFVFGDIYQAPKDIFSLRVMMILQQKQSSSARNINDDIDQLFGLADQLAAERFGKDYSLPEYKVAFKSMLANPMILVPFIVNPHSNKDMLLKQIGQMIDKQRVVSDVAVLEAFNNVLDQFEETTGLSNQDSEEWGPPQVVHREETQFVYPTSYYREAELQRYIQVHDMKKKGMSIQQIGEAIYPDSSSAASSIDRMVKRDAAKAIAIIANVELGFFPGDY